MSSLYNSKWRRLREAFLADHPLCVVCLEEEGRPVAATVVDHVVPHRGNLGLFWCIENWISVCETCHNSTAQRLEKSGRYVAPTGPDGYPIEISDKLRKYIESKRGR